MTPKTRNGFKKTVLITGGAGFIGSNFVRHLYHKYPDYQLLVLDALTYAGNVENLPQDGLKNNRFRFWYGNVRNAELVDTLVSQSDIVVHFAAESHVTRSIFDNLIFFETDVIGTQVVTNAVLKYMKQIDRFIHISTSEVYGSAKAEKMAEDTHPLDPTTPYASAKAGADRLVYSYCATYDIPAVIIRPFNNYGPYQHLEKVVPRFITSCLLDEPLTVHGEGQSSRDWVFVEDCCAALDRVLHVDLEKVRGQVINIGTGRSLDVATIAQTVIERMGKPKSLIQYTNERPGQVVRHTAFVEKAKRLLGWEAQTRFEEGLDRTIAWYTQNRKWWERQLWLRHIPTVAQDGHIELH